MSLAGLRTAGLAVPRTIVASPWKTSRPHWAFRQGGLRARAWHTVLPSLSAQIVTSNVLPSPMPPSRRVLTALFSTRHVSGAEDRSWSAKSARAALMSCWLNASTYARNNLLPSLMGAAGVWSGMPQSAARGRRRGAGAREEQDHSDQSHSRQLPSHDRTSLFRLGDLQLLNAP